MMILVKAVTRLLHSIKGVLSFKSMTFSRSREGNIGKVWRNSLAPFARGRVLECMSNSRFNPDQVSDLLQLRVAALER